MINETATSSHIDSFKVRIAEINLTDCHLSTPSSPISLSFRYSQMTYVIYMIVGTGNSCLKLHIANMQSNRPSTVNHASQYRLNTPVPVTHKYRLTSSTSVNETSNPPHLGNLTPGYRKMMAATTTPSRRLSLILSIWAEAISWRYSQITTHANYDLQIWSVPFVR